MLVEFKVRNFRSIRDELTLSMVASSDPSLPQNTVAVPGRDLSLLKVAAIFGANASGKSNLLQAMTWARFFIDGTIDPRADSPIPTDMFRFRADNWIGTSEFSFRFVQEGEEYEFAFTVDDRRVHSEHLFRLGGRRKVRLYSRELVDAPGGGKRTEVYKFGDEVQGAHARLIQKSTRANILFLTRATELNHPVVAGIGSWLTNKLALSHGRGAQAEAYVRQVQTTGTSDYLLAQPHMKAMALELLRAADLGIEDLEIELRQQQDPLFDRVFLPEARQLMQELTRYTVRFKHSGCDDGGDRSWIKLEEESHGTQVFYSHIGGILHCVQHGVCAVIDEIGSALHPDLLRALLQLVQGEGKAKPGFQLIFTTHDVTLMDQELLRRDQIWLVEKGQDGASRLRSLWDFKPRKGEALMRGYLAGRYGAVPNLRFDEITPPTGGV